MVYVVFTHLNFQKLTDKGDEETRSSIKFKIMPNGC